MNFNNKYTCNHQNLSYKCTHNKNTFRAGLGAANRGLANWSGIGLGWPRQPQISTDREDITSRVTHVRAMPTWAVTSTCQGHRLTRSTGTASLAAQMETDIQLLPWHFTWLQHSKAFTLKAKKPRTLTCNIYFQFWIESKNLFIYLHMYLYKDRIEFHCMLNFLQEEKLW